MTFKLASGIPIPTQLLNFDPLDIQKLSRLLEALPYPLAVSLFLYTIKYLVPAEASSMVHWQTAVDIIVSIG